MEVPGSLWKLVRGKNRMLSFIRKLIGLELRDVLVSKLTVILRIVKDGAAFFAVQHHDVTDISARSALRDAGNAIIWKLLSERLEQVDLGTLAKLLAGLLFERPLQLRY